MKLTIYFYHGKPRKQSFVVDAIKVTSKTLCYREFLCGVWHKVDMKTVETFSLKYE